ncbi:MAG: serine hydrolase domain-containing protein [Myxococcales bacterium]
MSVDVQRLGTREQTRLDARGIQGRLDAVIEEALEAQRIVGTVVVVLEHGRPLYVHAAGWADRESRVPMREDTVFRLASVTKPIVSVAALRLVEQGKLSLDAEVARYLPQFRPRLADGSAPAVSVRQLLTHTAGLSYGHFQAAGGSYLRAQVSDGLDQPGLGMEEELRRISQAGLDHAPGTHWGYSVAIDVLGAVIERVSGQGLAGAVRALVTGPLGMLDTGFEVPAAGLAVPYADGAPPVRIEGRQVLPFMGLSGISVSPLRAFDDHSFASGGAGMNGTARDVARMLEAVRAGGGGVLSAATARTMLENQVGDLPVVFGPGWGFGYGGAVLVDPSLAGTPQSAGTWSWGGVWGHSWFVDPLRALVVVGLTNTAIEGMMGQFPQRVRDALYVA